MTFFSEVVWHRFYLCVKGESSIEAVFYIRRKKLLTTYPELMAYQPRGSICCPRNLHLVGSYFNIANPKKARRRIFQTFYTGRCISLVILEGANVDSQGLHVEIVWSVSSPSKAEGTVGHVWDAVVTIISL